MLLVIALILATVALAALELWVFWKLGEQDDVRRRRERQTKHASNATRQHPCSQGRRPRRRAADLNRPSIS